MRNAVTCLVFILSFLCSPLSVAEQKAPVSFANATLARDVIPNIQTFISMITNDACQQAIAITDVVSTEIPASHPTGVWEEVWYVKACGQTYPFIIRFEPQPTGGTLFSVKMKK